MGAQGRVAGEVVVLEYPAVPGAPEAREWSGWVEAGEDGEPVDGQAAAADRGSPGGGADARESEEARRMFEGGRALGREEGRRVEREAQASAFAAEAKRVERQRAAIVERFEAERDRYLHAVEREVVKLALAVAARILRREAAMDPLLLTGAVRVALGQIASSSEVRLRVPAAELELWREAIAHVPNLTLKPEVAAGDGMRLGDCVIESRAGTVDLGVRAQLAEIEKGFFDREDVAGPRFAADAADAAADVGADDDDQGKPRG
jgi:flagellar biosynthesis/type III secretory pathway protein FliH